MDNNPNEIETYIEKLKKLENIVKNKMPFFKSIISKDEMDKFEKEELKTKKIVKSSWYDWYNLLINYVLKPMKNNK